MFHLLGVHQILQVPLASRVLVHRSQPVRILIAVEFVGLDELGHLFFEGLVSVRLVVLTMRFWVHFFELGDLS